jgi:hypothetical protein
VPQSCELVFGVMITTTHERSSPASATGLTRWQGFPLAIGSIAGSGILFLPSAVYSRAGTNFLLMWAIATLMWSVRRAQTRLRRSVCIRTYSTGLRFQGFPEAAVERIEFPPTA